MREKTKLIKETYKMHLLSLFCLLNTIKYFVDAI